MLTAVSPLTVTYDFLAVEHANSDKVMDVLIVIRSPESSPNKSCSDEGGVAFGRRFPAAERLVVWFSESVFQAWLRRVCSCWRWTGPKERRCGSGRWGASWTGPSAACRLGPVHPGTACCPIRTTWPPSTNTAVRKANYLSKQKRFLCKSLRSLCKH